MISVDDHPPPDPSSSDNQNHHQQKEVSHDLKINMCEKAPASLSDIDLLKPTDAILDDTNNPLPNFSIRGYVFGSRCKDIASNWPFSHESLQLCLHYGVKNLLPPFQSLENRLPNEEIRSSSDGKLTGSIKPQCHLKEDLAHIKSKKSHPASYQKTLDTTYQTSVKKYKFFMKLNSGVEPVEEVRPNNFIVSETMASKVCPVCKTFSSSSNTTLNAHIDRCLSEESSMKWTTNSKIMVKHRIKPRKTRLMVDIYKTAPCCTVEELDRRNGTSWATNSNFPDQELEFQGEGKKEEPAFIPEVAGHEGTVYIDTDGTKVRILSMPKLGTLDDHEARKLQKGGKGSKIITKKKKKKAYRQKNCQKILKFSLNSKKFCSLTPHHPVSEAIGGQEENAAVEERCNKANAGEKPMEARVHKQMDDLVITRPPWACSKRTGLTKKRSPMLTKPKEGYSLPDSYEDPLGTRSKGRKFSFLKDNILLANQARNAGSKFNLKRKLSTLKNSSVHCLSVENAVMGPCQDSLKQKSRIEEDTSDKLSFEMVDVMKAKRKKSITSKSSNGDSSEGLDIAYIDPSLDVESARIEVPSHSDVQGSFMGLRNSLDNEFSKMVNRLDNSQLHDIENIMIGHNTEDCINDIENQGNYFHEVDPIPIPGPPGSFLPPSPGGDMVSEELLANSSLTTTSRFQSGEDQYHHDTIDRDSMSDSPISTVSSSSDDKLSARFTSLQDTSLGKKSAFGNASDLRSVDAILTEKGPTPSGFQNEQPCVCSRKEGVFSKNVASYHQESRDFESNRRPINLNMSSELFSLINHPKLPPSLRRPLPPPESATVSPSTPVLRLMGKNLTVVKMDDDRVYPSQQFRPQNDQLSFLYGYPSQHTVIFNHDQDGSKPRHLNAHHAPWKATKEMIVIDDSSEQEADDPMRRNQILHSCNHPCFTGFPPW